MNKTNNGGPAFPAGYSRKHRPSHDPGADWVEVDRVQPLHFGVSVRDYFAAKAMQANRSRDSVYASWDDLAKDAYELADAMLKAREQ